MWTDQCLVLIRVSDEWMKLGARGLSIVVASGDVGVGCNSGGTLNEMPYPSSPWVTLVGSTRVTGSHGSLPSLSLPNYLFLLTLAVGKFNELGSYFSSGGFSNTWSMPSWFV